jgi:hypothetical protein
VLKLLFHAPAVFFSWNVYRVENRLSLLCSSKEMLPVPKKPIRPFKEERENGSS